jgi:hypothetical protein
MRRILEVLRLKFDGGLSDRSTARSLRVPRSTVGDYVARFEMSGLQWPLSPDIDEEALERALFKRGEFAPIQSRPLPEWTLLNQELKKKGVALCEFAGSAEVCSPPAQRHGWKVTLSVCPRQVGPPYGTARQYGVPSFSQAGWKSWNRCA